MSLTCHHKEHLNRKFHSLSGVVAGRSLRRSVAVAVERVDDAVGLRRVDESVVGRVEGLPGAHPEEHLGAEAVARRPEVVVVELGVGEVAHHRVVLLLRVERGELEAERAAVLVGEVVVELGRVRIHARHVVLDAVQLDRHDALT